MICRCQSNHKGAADEIEQIYCAGMKTACPEGISEVINGRNITFPTG